MQKISLLIICSDQAVRRGLASLLGAHGSFRVADQIDSVANTERIQRIQPDVILYGFYPDKNNITSSVSTLKEACPYTLVVFFSDSADHSHIKEAFTAGADGYLMTPILPSDLAAAIELACRGGICFLPRAAKETVIGPRIFRERSAGDGESHETGA